MDLIVIYPLHNSDIDQCVQVHIKAFNGFFLSILGPAFLKELYSAILQDPSGITFVAKYGGRVIGFVAGSDQPSGLFTRLLEQRLIKFGLACIPAIFRKPAIIPHIVKAFSKPREGLPMPNCGTLMSIAVDPEAKGNAVGQRLAMAFLRESSIRGLEYVNLITDQLENDHANRFYRRMGFELYRQFTTSEGRHMNEYLFHLTPEALKALSGN